MDTTELNTETGCNKYLDENFDLMKRFGQSQLLGLPS